VSEQNSIEELFRGRHFDREVIILCAGICATSSASAIWSR
jgi:hypothetical protein